MKVTYIEHFSVNTNICTNGEEIICRNGTELFDDSVKKIQELSKKHEYILFLISNENDKEICIYSKNSTDITIENFISSCHFYTDIIGFNKKNMSNDSVADMYYLLGKCKVDLLNFGLESVKDYYVDFINDVIHEAKCNDLKLFRIYCYDTGLKNKSKFNLCNEYILFKIVRRPVILYEKCLVVSKLIVGYGGNQKTAIQLIEMLEKDYDVRVLSIAISKRKSSYNYKTDKLNNSIHNSQILKIKNDEEIVSHINKSSYKFIINNKMNEFFSLLPRLNPEIKNHVITHNSMDPFNELIINNQQYISKNFTINNFHRNLIGDYFTNDFIENYTYVNHVKINEKINEKTSFSNRIAFVGRMSREKGIKLLTQSFLKFREKYEKNVELLIIGDPNKGTIEESEYYVDNDKIKYLGKMSEDNLKNELKNCDYLILPSYTEGIPFVILEAMSVGIPCIYSNINGADEIISDEQNGFLFNLDGYNQVKEIINSWNVFDVVDKYFDTNINNLCECINKAYSIDINKWNNMSSKCHSFIGDNYSRTKAELANKIALNDTKENSIIKIEKHKVKALQKS